ncbi:hypothetical protein N7494_001090 [Penicillium frequentans]|uniref:Uncharacterized protein n=1 Tax=Penicillium frequentans TaxID=3151616 RepID=A0AAD6D8X3_9EURO|nr:hypothetical protein N7494_001090 [Penicillium glabrum]
MSTQSGLDGWDNCKFEGYVKLLLLKRGRQIEEAFDFTDLLGEQTEVSDLESTDSVDVNILSQFDEDKLKRALLDRLSELVANKKGKGGHHVSASLMIEWPDKVDILVAKNTGLTKKGLSAEMLQKIESSLRSISRLNRQGLSYFLQSFS